MEEFILYFRSRKNMADKSTWGKEKLPADWTEIEVAKAAYLAGMEGFAIIKNNQILTLKWFV